MNKRDIKKVVKMRSDGLSEELSLRVLINLCLPYMIPGDIDYLATAIKEYNKLIQETNSLN